MGIPFAPESPLSSTPSQKKRKRPNNNPVHIIPETQPTSSNNITTSAQRVCPMQNKWISSQTSNDEGAPKLLRRSKGGINCSFPDAYISDSSDSNSVDIPNAQPDKYNPDHPATCDPNDGDVNTGLTDPHKKQLSRVNTDEEEVLMECELSDTQGFESQKSQPPMEEQAPPPKPSTDGVYSLVANSLQLSIL